MTNTRTLLLADVEDSTKLSERLGDAASAALWTAHERLARDLLRVWRGREIDKSDGFLLLFDAPADAVGYALAYHQGVAALDVPLKVRVGLHVGHVVLRENNPVDVALGAKPLEVDGIAKPTVARVMSLARGGQTLLTSQARDALGETNFRVQSHGYWVMKGLSDPVELFEAGNADSPFTPPADGLGGYRVARNRDEWLPVSQIANNLPEQISSFIGRERELVETKKLLADTRLLTLVGIGGIGKTRLSLRLAATVMHDYPDGVWVVELASLKDARLVPTAVASTVGVKEEARTPMLDAMMKHLKSRRVLLILDNCEHLLSACAEIARALLQGASNVRVMATSREPLRVTGEITYPLPVLAIPNQPERLTLSALMRTEAIQLFCSRAVAVQPAFRMTYQNANAIAAICRQLDGIPLALELAAARVRALSVEKIAERLSDRFRLLTGGDQTVLPRQQTLRALIDWSYDLLAAPEKLLLARLGVFVGGWTLEEAELICSGQGVTEEEVLDVLSSLVSKSLVSAEERTGTTRYRMLETVRQYARDQLLPRRGEESHLQARHMTYFLRLAEEAGPQLMGAHQQAWLERLETEHDNLRSALAWANAEEGVPAHALRLAGALWFFWLVRGHLSEGRRWLSAILANKRAEQDRAARAKALGGAGTLASLQCDFAAAQLLYEEGLAIRRELRDKRGTASALGNLGNVAYEQGKYAEALVKYDESLAARRELDDKGGVASMLIGIGNVAVAQGDYAMAQIRYEESLAIYRERGDRRGIAGSLCNLGHSIYGRGDYAGAQKRYEESLALRRELGDLAGVAESLCALGNVAFRQGDNSLAKTLFEQGLAIQRGIGELRPIAESLEGLACVLFAMTENRRAARIWGGAARLRSLIGTPLPPSQLAAYDRNISAARAAMGDASFYSAWREGEAVDLEQNIEFALVEHRV